ncbi:hypothetical protein L1887_10442 [Cichorium endivia]|nr:hypothetical protein L1887_10442 [Cichorium endivia]
MRLPQLNKRDDATDIEDEISYKRNPPLDEDDIALFKTNGLGPYSTSIKKLKRCKGNGQKNQWFMWYRIQLQVPEATHEEVPLYTPHCV